MLEDCLFTSSAVGIIDPTRKRGSIGFEEEEARVARLKQSLKLRLRGGKRRVVVVVDSTGKSP